MVSAEQCPLFQNVQTSEDASMALVEVVIVCVAAVAVYQQQYCVGETVLFNCRLLHSKFGLQSIDGTDFAVTATAQVGIWVTDL